MPNFEYGELEISYLKSKDAMLGAAIDRIGHLEREIIPDLFEGLVNSIVAQQISMKAVSTIWERIQNLLTEITPSTVHAISAEELQKVGITMKKAVYIKTIAAQVLEGALDLNRLSDLSDDAIKSALISLPGIGAWTAEMLMIFSMQRKDLLSWDDLAIRRGMSRLYHLEVLDRKTFENYRMLYSPYGSVAALYLWEISLEKPTEL